MTSKHKIDKDKRITIAEIKSDFEAEGEIFDDTEIEKIRNFLYLLAEISHDQYLRNKTDNELLSD